MNLVSSLMNWIKWPTNSCPYWTTQCTDDQRNSTTGHWNSFCVVLWCNRRHSKSSTKEQTVKVCINQIMWFNVSYSVNVQSMHEFIKFGVRRAPSSDRCCLCCTPPILRRWSPNIVCIPTCMRTIHSLLQDNLSGCFDDVWRWMCSNRLQLNALKTEFIWCAPARRHHHIPDRDVQVGHNSVHPVQSARDRDLGVYVDGSMTMRAHINHVLSSCYGTLRQLRWIKWSLPSHALNTLVTSLVHSRLDYCNVVFAGLPACDVQRLQSILNTAVHLVAGSSRHDLSVAWSPLASC